MKGYQALSIAIEKGNPISFKGECYSYKNGEFYNEQLQVCTFRMKDVIVEGWKTLSRGERKCTLVKSKQSN